MKAYFYQSFAQYEEDEKKNGDNVVAIVLNEKYGTMCADIMSTAKSYKTAVSHLFKGVDQLGLSEHFDGWKESLLESVECGTWADRESVWNAEKCRSEYIPGGWHYAIEGEPGAWYVEVTC